MKIGFFQESEGVNSGARLIFIIGSFWNIAMSTYFALSGVDPPGVLAFFAGIETSLGAIKVSQKYLEKKNDGT